MDPDFPKAILHVDGDSFFASCEVARRPDLKGKPVVTGHERGIATAMSKEAKALGVTRGMRVRDIRRQYPQVVIMSSDYDMYARYARRMYAIVGRYTDRVEEYSIDECFADLTGCDEKLGMTYEEIGRAIQKDLHTELGITFSIGVSVNKVMAKVASKLHKPAGFTMLPKGKIEHYLTTLPIGKVWGIGRSTTISLGKKGIKSAYDLYIKNSAWVEEHCDKPLAEIHAEFHGHYVKELSVHESHRDYASVQRTRTFHPPSSDSVFLWSQLSHHVEDACIKLRSHDRLATRVFFFIKTQSFEYSRVEVELPDPTSAPQDILRAMKPCMEKIFRPYLKYRAAGVTLSGLRDENDRPASLFGPLPRLESSHVIHKTIDKIAGIFGRHTVFLGSSMNALKREDADDRKKKLELIFLGQVK